MDNKLLEKFKNRRVRAKEIFYIKEIDKKTAKEIVREYHYLGNKDFMYTVAYGLFSKSDDELLGSAIFGVVGGSLALKSWFGVDNSHSNEYLELTRLVMHPKLNGCNATSFLLGNSIKSIKKDYKDIRAIISLADNSLHNGAIYQATNFKYFGLTNKKSDFIQEGHGYPPKRCGTTRDKHGVWLPRSQKHRYCFIIDDSVEIKFKEEKYPKGNGMNVKPTCCDGTHEIYDKRFNEWFTCPKCVGICEKLEK